MEIAMASPPRSFRAWEFPLAFSMVRLAEHGMRGELEPLEQFMCYWIGFNNICVTIANESGGTAAALQSGARPQFEEVGGFTMPRVHAARARARLQAVFAMLTPQLKETLILHRCTRFFVNRQPRFQGQELTVDARGQRLNGVLNIGKTLAAGDPVWSPVDHAAYYAYVNGARSREGADRLALEILLLLHTAGTNLFHGGRRADDASDINIVEQALPLLKEVVGAFVRLPERRAAPRGPAAG
jgi:hypothetical protein